MTNTRSHERTMDRASARARSLPTRKPTTRGDAGARPIAAGTARVRIRSDPALLPSVNQLRLKKTAPSGGSVTRIDARRSFQGYGTASTAPRFP